MLLSKLAEFTFFDKVVVLLPFLLQNIIELPLTLSHIYINW
jgi:hypothetical protein